MSFAQVLKALQKRDTSGRFAVGGKGSDSEGLPPKEGETEEDRAARARKLKLAAEQKARQEALDEKKRKRREVPEAKL